MAAALGGHAAAIIVIMTTGGDELWAGARPLATLALTSLVALAFLDSGMATARQHHASR